MANEQKHHFILVHGACHGAWSWYKVKPRLESLGHRVTVLDLAATGINMKSIQEVHTFSEYSQPLFEIMEALLENERVVLVGHSLGGLNLAFAMEKFPEKILLAVFCNAFVPNTIHKASYISDQYVEKTPTESWLDTQFLPYESSNEPEMSMFFGPKFLSSKLYQLSPIEDLELAKMLVRPGSLFLHDLAKAKKFSNQGYGSVARVCVIGKEDIAIPVEFQRWMAEIGDVKEVVEIEGADHMVMNSKPQQLCDCLLQLANKYTHCK